MCIDKALGENFTLPKSPIRFSTLYYLFISF